MGTEKARLFCRPLQVFEEELRELSRRAEGRDPRTVEPLRTLAIIGRSPAARRLVAWIQQAAPTSLPVLITGETGVGKDLVARVIHGESPRAHRPFVSLNCAALPGELLEAELFGYARGAFTGAENNRMGLLLSADGGTALLDGIAEMPLELQAKLLRVLDGRRIRPLGASQEVEVDLRFLFTSSRRIASLLNEGRLRRDLFFRMNALELEVPPLRERLEDLPDLLEHFRGLAASAVAPVFDEGAIRTLAQHPWPGNIRELQNVVTRLVLTRSERIRAEDVREVLGEGPAEELFSPLLLRSRPLDELLARLEKEYLLQLRSRCGGEVKAMARALGVTVFALYKRFRRLGIAPRR